MFLGIIRSYINTLYMGYSKNKLEYPIIVFEYNVWYYFISKVPHPML